MGRGYLLVYLISLLMTLAQILGSVSSLVGFKCRAAWTHFRGRLKKFSCVLSEAQQDIRDKKVLSTLLLAPFRIFVRVLFLVVSFVTGGLLTRMLTATFL